MSLTEKQRIFLVKHILAFDHTVKEAQLKAMKFQLDIETRKLVEKCKIWLTDL